MLAKAEIQVWLARKIIKVSGGLAEKNKVRSQHRLSLITICNYLSIDSGNLWNMIKGNRGFPLRTQKLLSDFIQDWESGRLEIQVIKNKKTIVQVINPRPKAQFMVDFHNFSLKNGNIQPVRDKMPRKLWSE